MDKIIFPNAKNWKRVLLYLYRHCPNVYFENSQITFWNDNHILAQDLKMRGSDLGICIEFLRKNELMKDNSSPINPKDYQNNISLTKKGFDVAFELEKQEREIEEKKRSEMGQVFTLFLTLILALTSLLTFAMNVYPESRYTSFWAFFILLFISIILIALEFRKR